PPSRVELVLTGMEGTLLIDASQHRLARIDGKLVKEVGFGWGILGHLNPGGHFLVDQSDVGYSRWEVTHMDLAFTGKLLFFKSLNIKSNETYRNFRPAPPNLTFAQAVELLKKEEAVVAQNHHENQVGSRRQTEGFLPDRQPFDQIFAHSISRAWSVAD